jgi:threonine dehydrogenase-like Zn-dependent dehydrogenase
MWERRKKCTKECVDALKYNVLCDPCAFLNMNPLGAAAHSVGRQLDWCPGLESTRLKRRHAANPATSLHAKDKEKVAPESKPSKGDCEPRRATSIALEWVGRSGGQGGTIFIVDVYGEVDSFPIGNAMEKNLPVMMGNCNHRRYLPHLIERGQTGANGSRRNSDAGRAYDLCNRGVQGI